EMMFELVHGPLRRDPAAFLRSVLTVTILSGAITYCWVRCAHRSLVWAALGGCLTGLVVSYLATLVDVCCWPGDYRIPRERLVSVLGAWRFHLQIGLNALAWASWGLAGAVVINRKWGPCPSLAVRPGRHPGRRPALDDPAVGVVRRGGAAQGHLRPARPRHL